MDATSTETSPSEILNLLFGFQTTQVIISLTKLGIFDAVESSENKRCSVKEICTKLNLNENCTERAMKMCVNIGLLKLVVGNEKELFTNTSETEKFLLTSSATSMKALVLRFPSRYESCENIIEAIKKGQEAVVPEYIASVGQITEEKFKYNKSMMTIAAYPLATVFDLSEFSSACDLAGCMGTFAYVLKDTYPDMKVSVLEQPKAVEYVMSKFNQRDTRGQLNVDFISGDMMIDELPSVDLFTMTHASMLFVDDQLVNFFSKIYSTLPKDGAFLICESLLNDDKCGPILTLQRDIAELVECRAGESNQLEYRNLLKKAGFENIKFHAFKNHICYDAILARKSNDK